ncbi:hypothetical protein PFISCL1PPCAC_17208 [Pristionchus fissidentatus]|uniref:Nuclear receptor domain-containing protein n=1 Tax=Pristionchus fissidentatus TaxID=1538716 RepID=A0AAV5W553_9BILA|nr:hypothetical protein PFISCL1PPCAC_17208 [Pristionchus fissidentatus]
MQIIPGSSLEIPTRILGPDEGRSCLICATPITASHFGMDACRACSSFFKRTRTTGRQYPCKQGDRRCTTFKDSKLTCRRCRFDKCVAVGLEYNGPIRIRRRPPTVALLQRVEVELRSATERRRIQELKFINRCDAHHRIPHATDELYNLHELTFYEIFGVFVAESSQFFGRAFPDFGELHQQERELIFKDFVGKFSIIECNYRSRQLWGDNRRL